MSDDGAITVTPVLVAELLVEGEAMPVCVHVIHHPEGRVLVDTGMTTLHPSVVAAFDPRLYPLSEQGFDTAGIDIVVNTHLHADHCGGNHLFAGRPIYVQRRELDDARSKDDYTIREWVDPPGLQYVPVDGELELLPGVRLVPAPGHTPGSQIVVVETGARPTVICGDTAVWFGELDEPRTEGQRRILALDPGKVWLAHVREPWQPGTAHAGGNYVDADLHHRHESDMSGVRTRRQAVRTKPSQPQATCPGSRCSSAGLPPVRPDARGDLTVDVRRVDQFHGSSVEHGCFDEVQVELRPVMEECGAPGAAGDGGEEHDL